MPLQILVMFVSLRVVTQGFFPVLVALALQACGGGGSVTDDQAESTQIALGQVGCDYQYASTPQLALMGLDPLVGRQWYLNNTGQSGGLAGEDLRVFAAWQATRGEGVRVAVVDDALDILHEDLWPNVVAGASYNYRADSVYPLPCQNDQEHGTAVAGIVAARDGNALGGVGVAPKASLVGYNALSTHFDADLADALSRGLDHNAIYNNSWGSPDNGRPNLTAAAILAAVDDGITTGRSGKGAVYVFPAGNGGCFTTSRAGLCQHETTGLDGYLNHRGVITVGSVDGRGRKPYFAEPGASLLVSAPSSDDSGTSAILTTQVRNSYRDDFPGASASAPMVSGVVALMLSANPQLSWRDVRLILAQTARRNDADDAGWVQGPPGTWFNHSYGFGVANAGAAVSVAKTWSSVGGSETLLSCGPYERTVGLDLPDAIQGEVTPREDRVVVGDACRIRKIEFAEVSFTARHDYAGDLRVRLISPNGLVSHLVDERVCLGNGNACGDYDDWHFGSVRHLGEAAVGEWRLQVTDAQSDDTGSWARWSLRLWGH